MRVTFDIKKKYAFAIIGLLVILAGIIVAYALGTVLDPGHALSTIQGYFSNDANLEASLGRFCLNNGTNCAASGSFSLGNRSINDGYWCFIDDPHSDDFYPVVQELECSSNPYLANSWYYCLNEGAINFLYGAGYGVRDITLEVVRPYELHPDTDWPLNGTKYIFNGGLNTNPTSCIDCNITNLPFNQNVRVFSSGSNYLDLKLNVVDKVVEGIHVAVPISIDVNLVSSNYYGEKSFRITYNANCIMYSGVCLT